MEHVPTGGVNSMTLTLQIDDDLSAEEGLVYIMLGDMFDVEVDVCDSEVVARGKANDVWAWLGFYLFEWEAIEA